MGRVLEVIFRRFLLLLLLVILLPLVSVAVAYVLPRSYQTNASLWALHRYEVIGATGPESDLLSTPAQTQATALTELLQSRAFALSVADATSLSSMLSASTQNNPQLRDDALFTEISQHVQVAPQGYNLFTITYSNQNPVVAQQVVQAVIQNFSSQSQGFSVIEGQLLLQSYQAQLVKAKQDAATAAAAEAAYIGSHQNIGSNNLANDPEYALLHAQTQQAQATLSNIQTTIATINQEIGAQGVGSSSLFKVLDAPKVATQAVSRSKNFLVAGGIGLGLAILACVLYVVIASRRDRTIYSPLDLQKVTNLPVIMELPYLSTITVPGELHELIPHRDEKGLVAIDSL